MEDKEQLNDDYQFTEQDPLNPGASDVGQETSNASAYSAGAPSTWLGGSRVKRNALIAIIIFIILMLGYSFFSAHYGENKDDIIQTAPSAVPPSPKENTVIEPPPPVPQLDTSSQQSDIQTKLLTVESNQENIRSDIVAVNSQIGNLDGRVEALIKKIDGLTSVISSLSSKLDAQSLIIESLKAKPVPKLVKRRVNLGTHSSPQYFIQAVIPGRAWLIATNGNTLTVREGSVVLGYGRVKLIDPNQGRVITTSGRVIRFNQNDS